MSSQPFIANKQGAMEIGAKYIAVMKTFCLVLSIVAISFHHFPQRLKPLTQIGDSIVIFKTIIGLFIKLIVDFDIACKAAVDLALSIMR